VQRRVRRAIVVLSIGASAAYGVLVGCGDVPGTNYGNPNTLDRRNLPGEGGVVALVCSPDAGRFDGGNACPSFAGDIFPLFTPQGAWQCSTAACHGGASTPPVDGKSAAGCLASLKAITISGQPYIADGGPASSLLCNLQGTCGSPMPKAPGKPPTNDELCKVQKWLECGSPP
jgi:hypothetical protein